jgi:hypothetical protein
MAIDMKQFELDRITTMLKSFGWSVTSSSFLENKVVVTFEKIIKTEVAP